MTLTEAEDVGSRVRTARLARGMSLRALAKKVGVSASMLSLLETGRSRSSVSTLYAIVEALDMSMVDLFDSTGGANGARPPGADPAGSAGSPGTAEPADSGPAQPGPTLDAGPDSPIAVVRRDCGRRIEMEGGVVWEQLGHLAGDGTEFLLVTYPPGAKSSATGRFQRHTDHERGYIMAGELTCRVGFEEVTLQAGDSVVFDSSRPHLLENRGETDVRAVWFIVRAKPLAAQ